MRRTWMHFGRLVLGLLGLSLLLSTAQAQFLCFTNNGAITIVGYVGPGGDVTIPSTINGLPVTSIGNYAFESCSSVTTVTIPSGVTNIGKHAFESCTNLTNITMPDSLGSIGDLAFLMCTSLRNVEIPAGVTNIGEGVFEFCTSLSVIAVDQLSSSYSSLEGVLFNKGQTTLIQCPAGKAGDYSIPGTVTTIKRAAFYFCINLTNVIIPGSVTTIDAYAFDSCTNLTNVIIPESVTTIGSGAFRACNNLTEVTVAPLNLWYNSRDGVLFDETETVLVLCPAGKAGSLAIPQGVLFLQTNAFAGCTKLINVTIPNSVTSIEDWAFNGCIGLTTIVIPDSVTNLGRGAFCFCPALASITIGSGITTLHSDTLGWCHSLTNLFIPNSVTNIEANVCNSCTGLTHVTIGAGATHIHPEAFSGCRNLAAIDVEPLNPLYSSLDGVLLNGSRTVLLRCPEGRTGAYAVPNGVSSLGTRSFSSCAGLTSLTIPNSVTNIGDYAFELCANLKTITFGAGLTRIMNFGSLFLGCTNLAGMYFHGNAPAVGSLFFVDDRATVYYLPGTTGWKTTFAFRPTAFWVLPCPAVLTLPPNFGVQSNGFGFIVSWATNIPVVVEACTDLANPGWTSVSTNALTNGWSRFIDPEWAQYPTRFYRLRALCLTRGHSL